MRAIKKLNDYQLFLILFLFVISDRLMLPSMNQLTYLNSTIIVIASDDLKRKLATEVKI